MSKETIPATVTMPPREVLMRLAAKNMRRGLEEHRETGPNSNFEKLDHMAGAYCKAIEDAE